MIYDQYGREITKWDIAEAIDIAREHAEQEREYRAMDDEWRANLVAKVNRGEITPEQALWTVRLNGILALVAMPVLMFLAILSPFALIFVATYPIHVLLVVAGLVFLCKRRKKSTAMRTSIECSRCRNPYSHYSEKFCPSCGYKENG
ncbi:MAG: hypothetical protein MN733_06165 [Nitrososphaera sp.]|nr:hypothetical protein [Nitrososphaera sp.]